MPKIERVRDVMSGIPNADYLNEKAAEGWRLVAVEWERDVEGVTEETGPVKEEVPFGMKVSEDCLHLEENPTERRILLLMLQGIVDDKSLSQVADELNGRGCRTRRGAEWTQTAVFAVLPRLIEVAPRIFSSGDWVMRKVRELSPL